MQLTVDTKRLWWQEDGTLGRGLLQCLLVSTAL